jgi:heme/copper-type cytochrome/quinol oxidase subunit 1
MQDNAHHDVAYLHDGKGLKSWLFTLDHKRIGVMYLFGVLIAFALGGTFALLLRTELLTPGKTFVEADTYNRFYTLHGAVMVFIFIIPSIPSALGNFVLPLHLGAKDVAFPRLNLLSFWIWGIGTILALLAIVLGGVDTGWTFYTPVQQQRRRRGHDDDLRGLRARLLLNPHGPELHRHGPQDARPAWASSACRCSSGRCTPRPSFRSWRRPFSASRSCS